MVTINVRGFGAIKVELNWEQAPNTCANFVALARSGFYDGLTFHRIIKNFMIQGGDPLGNGTGGPGYSIAGEFAANGVKNAVHHGRGAISMARAMDPNSAGSQFFICDTDDRFLDGQYAAFGSIPTGDAESFKTLDAVASVRKDATDRPLKPVVIDSIVVSDDEPVREVKKIA